MEINVSSPDGTARHLLDRHHLSTSPTSMHRSGYHHARLCAMVDFAFQHIINCENWLDIGCASGKFLSLLDRHKIGMLIGADLSFLVLQSARKQHGAFKLLQMTWTNMAMPNESCDVISALESLGHLSPKERVQAMAESHRILKPGGWMLISIKMGPALGLVTENELIHLLQNHFRIVDRITYDRSPAIGINSLLEPVISRLGYYVHVLQNVSTIEPSSTSRKIILFLACHAPFLLVAGEGIAKILLRIAERPLTSPWVGRLLWKLGLERAKRHATGLALLCKKEAVPSCIP